MEQPPQPQQQPSAPSAVPAWFLGLVAGTIIVAILYVGSGFLIPLALATLLFVLTMAIIERLDSMTVAGKTVPRSIAYIGATVVVFGLLAVLGYVVSDQAAEMSESSTLYAERLAGLRAQLEGLIGVDQVASLERAIQEADVEGFLSDIAASAAGLIGNVGLIVMYLAFMLAERGAFFEKLPRLCKSPEDAAQVRKTLNSISIAVQQYMAVNAATSAMSAVLSFAVLTFLGVDFAAMLALTVFFLNFIPNIGSILAVLIQTTMAFLQLGTLTPVLTIVVVYGGGDAIIGNIIQPRMQGKSLNLSTFMVMVALTFWSTVWGGVGALLATPMTVVIMIVCAEIPGLQVFSRLLSSDGRLRSDTDGDPEPALSGQSLKAAERDTETDPEVAALRQELEDLKPDSRKSGQARDQGGGVTSSAPP